MSQAPNIIAELNRIKVMFQQRALLTVMGIPMPKPAESDRTEKAV